MIKYDYCHMICLNSLMIIDQDCNDDNDDSNSEHDDIYDHKHRCVPGTARCSGKADCTDASDEFEYVKDEDDNK